jgi:hypothetical protein
MSLHPISRKTSWRRAAVVLACWLVALQTFFAGLHAADLGMAAVETSFVICHSGDASAEKSPGGKDSSVRLLCGLCALAAGTMLLPAPVASLAAPLAVAALVDTPQQHAAAVLLRSPRAGLSRAPPPFA